jgi:predicted MFS family arabinose efflux permease
VLLGGILTSGLGWRWVLFVNVPIGLTLPALAPRILRESRAEDGASTFDFLAVTAGLSLLVHAIVDAVNKGRGSAATLSKIGGAHGAARRVRDHRAARAASIDAVLDFRLRTLRGANVVGLLVGMSLLSMFFFLSLYLHNVLHYSPIKTGVSYLPLAVGIILYSGAASALVTRIGFKPVLIAGLLLIAGALIWFSRLPAPGGSYATDVLGPPLLAAVGLGFAFVPVTVAAVTGTKPQEAGLASGLSTHASRSAGRSA